MSDVHTIRDDERKADLAWTWSAPQEAVDMVMAAEPGADDGRSGWQWLRLANGDLMLGVFPRGETYFAVENYAQLPADAKSHYDSTYDKEDA